MESEKKVFKCYRKLFKLNKTILNDENAVYIQRPLVLGLYRDCDEMSAELTFRYFREPKNTLYPLDLQAGFIPGQYKPSAKLNGMDKIQKFLLNENVSLSMAGTTTILTQRGCLTHLMCIPYAWRTNQLFHVIKYCGVIILTDPSLLNRHDNVIKKTKFHADRFVRYCFSETFNGEPVVDSDCASGKSLCGINRINLQDYNIIYSIAMCGIVSNRQMEIKLDINEINKLQFVATKTVYRQDETNYYYTNQLRLRWWVEAYLGNVDDVFIARKDNDGKVRCPVEHKTAHGLQQEMDFDPLICNQFLYKFLKEVEKIMENVDCPYTVYEFKYDAAFLSIKYKIYERNSDLSCLSAEFIEYLKKHSAK